jgi:hypothetical protein
VAPTIGEALLIINLDPIRVTTKDLRVVLVITMATTTLAVISTTSARVDTGG